MSSTINDLTYLAIGLQMAAGAKKSLETEIKSVPDTVIVVDAAGKANVVIKGVEMSVHSAQRATERGISIENIKNAMDAKPFQYKQGGEWLKGYYDATTNTFVGVGSRITTVIKPKNPANYLANLKAQQ